MAGSIFISYRRDDSPHAAGRLYDSLTRSFRREQLFMDIDAIDPGLDFVKVIEEKVSACDVLIAVIGPSWLTVRNEEGVRRLDDPNDFVRLEIETALKRDVRVIPVLVDAATIPKASDLPESLRPLIRRNAVRIAHDRFAADATGLVAALQRVVAVRDKPHKTLFPWLSSSGRSRSAETPAKFVEPPVMSPPGPSSLAGDTGVKPQNMLPPDSDVEAKRGKSPLIQSRNSYIAGQIGFALLGIILATGR